MESRGTITNRKYNGESAEIVFENKQLIFSTKPNWVRLIFGIIGEALVPAKERFRINITDVTSLKISETWTSKPIFEITTSDDTCKITFNRNDELTSALRNELKDRVTE